MNLTILFDLDNTLLFNNKDSFLKEYFKTLAAFAASKIGNVPFLEQLNESIERMVQKKDPTQTLQVFFDQSFFPSVNVEKEILIKLFNDFYRDEFPALQEFTSPISAAKQCVEEVFRLGGRVVIATNPLFPQSAVAQRLEWAGLSPTKYPFSLVTTYENMHFAKPNPAYFAEILGQLGWPQGPVLMVGNDFRNDILPAAVLGFTGFWLSQTATENRDILPMNVHSGNWDDFHSLLTSLSSQGVMELSSSPRALQAVLASTPAALETIISGLSHEQLTKRPDKGQWCTTEVLCHLRDVDAEVNLPRVKRFLTEKNPFIAGENTDSWADLRKYYYQDGYGALAEFTRLRVEFIHLLESLSKAEWGRTGRHAIFGPTTLAEIIKFLTTHDQVHIQQVLAAKTRFG